MGVRASQVTVGTEPTRLDVVPDERPENYGSNTFGAEHGQSILMTLPSVVYINGDNAVSTSGDSRGFPAPAGTYTFDLKGDDALYGVVTAGTAVVEVLQVGVRAADWGTSWGSSPWGGS